MNDNDDDKINLLLIVFRCHYPCCPVVSGDIGNLPRRNDLVVSQETQQSWNLHSIVDDVRELNVSPYYVGD